MKKSILSFMLALSLFSSVLFSACSSGESSAVYNNSIVLKAVKDADLNSDDNTEVKKVLENRLTEMNITKYAVETDEEAKTFTVKYTPEEKQTIDEKELSSYLSTPAKLTFRPGNQYKNTENDANGNPVYKTPTGETEKVLMDGSSVKSAGARQQQESADGISFVVELKFTDEGARTFEKITTEYLNQTISVWLDDVMISAPKVVFPITDGSAVINGIFTKEEAEKLAKQINSGALPCALEQVK